MRIRMSRGRSLKFAMVMLVEECDPDRVQVVQRKTIARLAACLCQCEDNDDAESKSDHVRFGGSGCVTSEQSR
jgi:hypothetical protein